MSLLKKIEASILEIESSMESEASITLSYTELLNIRKNLLVENLNTELCADSMRQGIVFRELQRRQNKKAI
jgi:hypothetical protein